MCGTNGMCAGNTPEEALIQGISEVFERYVIRSIFRENITPPTVPVEYFQNTTILDRIRRLGEVGITAVVKDCSLGLGLPVIGLLLTNQENNKYTFHVGADPSPITALERCLTEIYQGNPRDVEARFHPRRGKSLSSEESDPADKASELDWQAAYYDTTSGGLGKWPESIFGDKATYPFTGFSHPVSTSDTADLAYLLAKIKDLERNLFIRDVSFLGFPAYQVFVPGMSETDFIFDAGDLPNWMGYCQRTAYPA